jgi:hypothetical protein
MSRLYIEKDTLMATINESLIYWGGGTFGKIVYDWLIETDEINQPFCTYQEQARFFQPYETKENLLKIYSAISAPIIFLLLAAEMALGFLVYTVNSLIAGVSLNEDEFKDHAITAGKCLLNTIIFCVAAVLSPIINLADAIGSGISTGVNACTNDDPDYYRMCC